MQHHGYPTPILDWTDSPFVAAFFAFRKVDKINPENVRIYVFDEKAWKKNFSEVYKMDVSRPYFSIWRFPAIENERVVPQQAVSTGTNVDDLEPYIIQREGESGVPFLWAFDIPGIERTSVMKELAYMGITAGTLFPGLDGACEELRERNFE